MKTEIEIRDLTITYNNRKKNRLCAIENVNLNIPKNKITMIIGPSGCGKSTLLKSINRLHDIDENVKVEGTLKIGGEEIYHTNQPLPELRRKVGLIHQKPTPLPFSIWKNVAYGLKIHNNISKEELNVRVRESLERVHLWKEVKDRLNSPAVDLSLGQQQRLSIARAIAINPEVLLCDEITSALDPISSQKVEDLLTTLSKDYTIVLVSHILRQVKRLADYVIFIYMGKIIESGTVSDFFTNPQNELTQNYINGLVS
jgi:phosphate transport system ATP-binding protein